MIEAVAFFPEDVGTIWSLRRSTKQQIGILNRNCCPTLEFQKVLSPVTASAVQPCSMSAYGFAEGKLCLDRASVQPERDDKINQEK